MKITSVECYLGTGAIGGFVTMKINTDSGIYGWGEAGLAYGKSAEAAFGQCQDFGKLILGMDPFNTEEIWEHLHRHTFWGMGGGVVITSAMAAIDIACWDQDRHEIRQPCGVTSHFDGRDDQSDDACTDDLTDGQCIEFGSTKSTWFWDGFFYNVNRHGDSSFSF